MKVAEFYLRARQALIGEIQGPIGLCAAAVSLTNDGGQGPLSTPPFRRTEGCGKQRKIQF